MKDAESNFDDQIAAEGRKLSYKFPKNAAVYEQAVTQMKERNKALEFDGWDWGMVMDEFLNAANCLKVAFGRSHSSGKRGSKR